jgi:hypothetical protein
MPLPARSRWTRAAFGWDDYERLGDAALDALADKFDVGADDRLEIGRSHPFGARVSITPMMRCMSGSMPIPGRAGDFP